MTAGELWEMPEVPGVRYALVAGALKVREYLAAGTRLVWVLWPKHRSVTVHSPSGASRDLGPEAELDGGDVLPGFRAPVAELFAVRRRR